MTERPRGQVLHIVRRAGEPSQTFVLETIRELQEVGWQTHVLSLLPAVGAGRSLPLVEPDDASLWRRVRRRLVTESETVHARHASAAAVAATRPDVVHVQFGWTATQVDVPSLGVPTLVSFHGSDVNAWPHRDPANLAAYRKLFAAVDHVTAVSDLLASRLRELGYAGHIEVVPAGVTLERFAFGPPDADLREPRLLFVGRLVECKGIDTLIAALPPLVDRWPGLNLDVVGDGEGRTEAELMAAEVGVRDRVRFRGAQGHAEVAAAMRAAHLLVVPSRRSADGEEEGSPVAPKEGLATGIPVVATNVGGIPDVMPPEFRDELVAQDDPAALAAQIQRILNAPDEWAERARVGRRWVEEQFDSTRLATRVDAMYQALVRPAGGAITSSSAGSSSRAAGDPKGRRS